MHRVALGLLRKSHDPKRPPLSTKDYIMIAYHTIIVRGVINISSINIIINVSRYSLKIMFIKSMNTIGAFTSPNDKTKNS